jgi:DNA-binding response OmpR family regulator
MMAESERHILVVDDEPDICENLRDILLDFGYRVDTAADGPSALALLERGAYDIALVDLKMPGMDGVELCRRIREQRTGTVGMILSAYVGTQAAADATAAGAWRVLAKPINPAELMGLIEMSLDTPLVMVVDDDRDLCGALRDALSEHGFRVSEAYSIGDAEHHLRGGAPHVVLIDLKLADADGLDVVRQVQARSPAAHSFVITAFRDEMASRIGQAMELGATSVHYKPFEPRRLIEAIRVAVGGSRSMPVADTVSPSIGDLS